MNLAGIAYAGVGWGLLWLGKALWRDQIAFRKVAVKTTGTVTEVLKTRRRDGGHRGDQWTTYSAPVVEFRANGDTPVVYRSSTYTSPNPYKVGMEIPVWYDPSNPSDAQLSIGFMTSLFPGLMALGGTAFIVIGVAGTFGFLD